MLLLPCFLNMTDMSKFPIFATGSCHFGGIAAQVNVMQCCRLFREYYKANVIKKCMLQFGGLNPSFFMIWEDLAHLSPYVEPPLGQLKLLSRPIDALVRNVSTGTYVLCYRAKLEKLTFNYCNFCYRLQDLWLKVRLKMHFLQVECQRSSRSGADPDLRLKGGQIM